MISGPGGEPNAHRKSILICVTLGEKAANCRVAAFKLMALHRLPALCQI
jgi:hypothetical protein